jgi:H+-transporting ATPase
MPIMLWIAAIIEGIIENFADMGILLGIQFINAAISFYETSKAGNAVAALKASLKPSATVKRDGKWQNMNAALIVPGDLVLLAAGSAVPADSYVNEGEIEVDQSAMTGEDYADEGPVARSLATRPCRRAPTSDPHVLPARSSCHCCGGNVV